MGIHKKISRTGNIANGIQQIKRPLITVEKGEEMAIYRPSRDKKQVIENILKDLDPALRDLARSVLENMKLEELLDKRQVLEKLKRSLGME
ncbi:MAG: hypothetical protein QXU13_01855 [Desulfurococcaceae archaeon]